MKRLWIGALLVSAWLTLPQPAAAHIRVTASTPAAGSTSTAAIHEVRLTFSQRVERRYTQIRILGPGGLELPVSALEPADSTLREFVATLATPLPSGDFKIAWRTAGADGHVITGEIPFTVAVEVLDTATTVIVPPGDPGTAGIPQAAYDPNSRPLAVLVRWFNLVAILLAMGAVAFRVVIVPASAMTTAPESYWSTLDAAVRRMGVLSGGLVLAAAVPRFLLQSAALHGSSAMFDPGNVSALLLGTTWGVGWITQAVAGAGLMVAARQPSRLLAIVSALALALAPALSGHAAAVEGLTALAVVADALHVTGAATWLGTLAMVVLVALPIAVLQGGAAHNGLAALVRAFSPVALTAAAATALSGVAAALLHITGVSQLWTTGYGRALLVKLAVVAAVAALGFHNWRRVRPRLGQPESSAQLRRSARLELSLAMIVVLVTAILIALPTPD